MKSRLPKVLHTVGGRAMLAHVYDTAQRLEPETVHIVFNPDCPEVRDSLPGEDITWVPQAPRLGTGHAVQQAMPGIPDASRVLVLYGDLPLMTPAALEPMLRCPADALAVLTMCLDNPAGYGRILRGADGGLEGIVEERDADAAQRTIDEVNTGIMLAPADRLGSWLERLGSDNSQGEYYLTDVVALAVADDGPVLAVEAPDAGDFAGANDQLQLAALENRLRRRLAETLMRQGVRIADPARIDLRGEIRAGSDVSLDVNVVLEGPVELGDGVRIGPGCVLSDCEIAAGTRIHPYSVLEGVRTLGACDIGPFARLRPGTELGSGSRVGNFVEVKNTRIGENSKASHLSYLGDSSIGRDVNIGAGTITCNYDGANKHRTEIEDGVFIGSDTQLVAPVRIGRNANIGAGSTITKDAPEGKLTLSRARQITIDGWKRPKKGEA